MPVTIKDIAKRANVTKTTVSYVINDKPGVSEEMRQKILNIIKEMDFQPNTVAQGLAGKSTNMIGLVMPDISDMFYADIIRGVERIANQSNYTLNLCTTHAIPEKESMVTKSFTGGRVDGVILMTFYLEPEYIHSLKKKKIPFVFIGVPLEDKSIYTVVIDNREAGFQATQYLIAKGHRKIAFITGPQDSWDSAERLKGYCLALKQSNIAYRSDFVRTGEFQETGGYDAVKALLQLEEKPTAIFAANDQIAIGATNAAKELGIKIPAQLSIVGFDDIQAASVIDPPLTTMRQPTFEMGSTAAEILFGLLNGEKPSRRKTVLQSKLIERASVRSLADS